METDGINTIALNLRISNRFESILSLANRSVVPCFLHFSLTHTFALVNYLNTVDLGPIF